MIKTILVYLLLTSLIFPDSFISVDRKQLKSSIKNLTRKHAVSTVVDLTFNEKKIIGFVNGSQQLEYKLTGETVIISKEFGNMGLVITDKNLLAISNNATEFSRQPLYGDAKISYTISNSIIFVATNKNIYYYTLASPEWKKVHLTGESVRTHGAYDSTGTLITNKRLLSYSENTKDFHFFEIDNFTPIYSFTVLDNKIVFDSLNKTIIFRPSTGEYTVVNFNK